MISSGIGWTDIERMVKEERKAGNQFANLIYKMNLEKNQVSLMLDAIDEDEDDSSTIEIDDKLV